MRAESSAKPLPIRARLLGTPEIQVGTAILPANKWPRRSARALLYLLLLEHERHLARDVVLEHLWPETTPESGLNSLYKTVHVLRRILEPALRPGQASAYVLMSQDRLALRPEVTVQTDVMTFRNLVRDAPGDESTHAGLREALALYRGDLLADEPFATWVLPYREQLQRMRERAVLSLARLDFAMGEPHRSVATLESLLHDDPTCVEAHKAFIRILAASGQRLAALRQLERCRLILELEFDSALDAEMQDLRLHLLNDEDPGIAPAIHSRINDNPGLPNQTFGRTQELEWIASQLRNPETRLVTLVGTGGVGKTRLAIETGQRIGPGFPGGCAFVDLSAEQSVDASLLAVARVLQIVESPLLPAARAIEAWLLHRGRFLLVLDNLEHLAGIEQWIALLLQRVPSLTILATSRMPLRIRAERTCVVLPLASTLDNVPPLDVRNRHAPAVELLLDRVAAIGGVGARCAEAQVESAIAICRRLDGLPLALELAAARSSGSELSEILEQLDDRFAILQDGPRDLPARHLSLEATIDWSYLRLSDAERQIFRALSVFAGGIDMDIARKWLGVRAAALLNQLADKHLVRREVEDGTNRFTMFESIRAYAMRKLDELGEAHAWHQRYVQAMIDLVGPGRRISGPRQFEWLASLERNRDSILAALRWCLDEGLGANALALTCGMGWFWYTRGPTVGARRWIERALAIAPAEPLDVTAWSALWGAGMAWRMADDAAGQRFEVRARELWSALAYPNGLAWVDYVTAIRIGTRHEIDAARRLFSRALETFEANRDIEGIVFCLTGIARCHLSTGQPHEAIALLEQADEVARTYDDVLLRSFVTAWLPDAWLQAGDARRALAVAEAGERLALLVGDGRSLPQRSMIETAVALAEGDFMVALDRAKVTLQRYREVGDLLNEWRATLACMVAAMHLGNTGQAIAYALDCLAADPQECDLAHCAGVLAEVACLLQVLGHEVLAVELAAASEQSGFATTLNSLGNRRNQHLVCLDDARDTLGSVAFEAAWVRGKDAAIPALWQQAGDVLRRENDVP